MLNILKTSSNVYSAPSSKEWPRYIFSFDKILLSLETTEKKTREAKFDATVEALVSGHPRDAIKMSVTGAGRIREWFS